MGGWVGGWFTFSSDEFLFWNGFGLSSFFELSASARMGGWVGGWVVYLWQR